MKNKVKNLTRSGMLLAVAIVFQIIGVSAGIPQINQFLVGSVVNAVLILTTCLCGIWWGVAIGILTPLTAWILGQLASPLLPFSPCIMAGNAIFVIIFGLLNRKGKIGQIAGYGLGAVLKYLFLYFTASWFVTIAVNLPAKISRVLVVMMGIPQLITAAIGGAVALFIADLVIKKIKD